MRAERGGQQGPAAAARCSCLATPRQRRAADWPEPPADAVPLPGRRRPRPSRSSPGRARGITRRSRVGPRASAAGGRAPRVPFPRGSRAPSAFPWPRRPRGRAPATAPHRLRPPAAPSRGSSSFLRLPHLCITEEGLVCCGVRCSGATSERRRCDAGVQKDSHAVGVTAAGTRLPDPAGLAGTGVFVERPRNCTHTDPRVTGKLRVSRKS